MDPTVLILSALTSGATAALSETVETVVKDAYQGLKTLIQKKFAGKPKAEMVLEEHAREPETWNKPLEKVLHEEGADQDSEIVQAAERLLELIQAQSKTGGKYDVRISGSQGIVIGDNAQVEQHFDDLPRKKR